MNASAKESIAKHGENVSIFIWMGQENYSKNMVGWLKQKKQFKPSLTPCDSAAKPYRILPCPLWPINSGKKSR
jgi:hypothetical protein